jgi:hypothetical protein
MTSHNTEGPSCKLPVLSPPTVVVPLLKKLVKTPGRHLGHAQVQLGTVRVFRQKLTLEDAIGCHACSLEANMRVNGIPLGCSLLLVPVHTANCVQTLKVECIN